MSEHTRKQIQNALRQIIFNELEMNRQQIREELRQVVQAEAEKLFRDGERMQSTIESALHRAGFGRYGGGRAQITSMIEKAADARVRKIVSEKVDSILESSLTVSIATKPPAKRRQRKAA